jgi:hypothetical protein
MGKQLRRAGQQLNRGWRAMRKILVFFS